MSAKNKIIFDREGKDWILSVFNKGVDTEGFIIENKDKSRITTPEGREITRDELAIIKKGSEKFIAGDLTSLMKLSKGEF
jgi:hypothetical protein